VLRSAEDSANQAPQRTAFRRFDRRQLIALPMQCEAVLNLAIFRETARLLLGEQQRPIGQDIELPGCARPDLSPFSKS
jgi:hypothetical protein